VRIIWGVSDTIFDASSADYLDQTFSHSRGVRRLEGAKLFWPEEQPDVVSMEAISLWNVSLLCPASQC
jgi:haloalkane dehalogenase